MIPAWLRSLPRPPVWLLAAALLLIAALILTLPQLDFDLTLTWALDLRLGAPAR